jgi:hypothetical protein
LRACVAHGTGIVGPASKTRSDDVTKLSAATRTRVKLGALLGGLSGLLCVPAATLGGDGAEGDLVDAIIRVEEDWVMVLVEPNGDVGAPQFHSFMSPYNELSSVYAQITWNYRESPDFSGGGLQLQFWDGGECPAMTRDVGEDSLSSEAETVLWTQSMETNGSRLTFRVINGYSSSWGLFGGDQMTIQPDHALANLNNYRTGISKSNSWITYGQNRVLFLAIVQARRYSSAGLISADNTLRIIYQQDH